VVAKSTSGESAALPSGAVSDCLLLAHCYSLGTFRTAYGIQPLLDHGIDGRGRTVVLVDTTTSPLSPPKSTYIQQDLARF
jgi:hypothetical protein